jgi:hypothetical protein
VEPAAVPRPQRIEPAVRVLPAALQRIYVLFFLSLATRRVEFIAWTPNPDGA